MERRTFFGKTALGGVFLGSSAAITGYEDALAAQTDTEDVVIERSMSGQPHKGKVLAIVVDDIPILCAGTCAKLINEGYTGYLIRTTNNEKCGDGTTGENILNNEQENFKIAETLGISDVFEFYYRQHRLHSVTSLDIRFRMIFIFRYLKVDAVITYNPWDQGEENPDHLVTGRVVEEASWMAGIKTHLPEQFEAGVSPHTVKERYYMVTRPGQPFNRIVDISSTEEQKIKAIVESKSQGGGSWGSELRKQLARQNKRIPMLGNDDDTADSEFVRNFLLHYYSSFEGMEQYGLQYAERFYYIDQRKTEIESRIEEFVEKHAVKL